MEGAAKGVAPIPFSNENRGVDLSSGGALPGELSVRRKAAVKKAFKRLDPLGSGAISLQDAFEALAVAPQLTTAGQEELKQAFTKLASQTGNSGPVLVFAGFLSYYHDVSSGISSESDFEQLLEAHWGYLEVSDIIAALQRQLTLAGLSIAFKGYTEPGQFSGMAAKDFDGCLKRVGLNLRAEDLRRLFGAFSFGQGLGLGEFKEQLVSPRPETPVPLTRGLQTTTPAPAMTGIDAALMPGPPGGLLPAPAPPMPSLSQPAATLPPVSSQPVGPGSAALTSKHPAELHAMVGQMEAEMQNLKNKKAAFAASSAQSGTAGPPPKDAELDAALSRMEEHLHNVKVHKAHVDEAAKQQAIADLGGLAVMPHWEHHKYGHHKITAPEWKPDKKITDMYGEQHNASEYHYSNYGAGAHGHHVAHFHLNDYHGLAHHSFKNEEYQKTSHGDKAHHGHWVPHLHGIGLASHHGEHAYGDEEYGKHAYGKPGHHSHWVPHLHGIGNS